MNNFLLFFSPTLALAGFFHAYTSLPIHFGDVDFRQAAIEVLVFSFVSAVIPLSYIFIRHYRYEEKLSEYFVLLGISICLILISLLCLIVLLTS